jgi:hypothetical protein
MSFSEAGSVRPYGTEVHWGMRPPGSTRGYSHPLPPGEASFMGRERRWGTGAFFLLGQKWDVDREVHATAGLEASATGSYCERFGPT